MQGCLGNRLYQHKKAFTLLIKNIFSMVLYSLYVFQCTRFQMDGIFPRTSVNSPLYVRRLYMQGCLVTFCITQEGLCIIHLRYYFNGFVFFVCISVHPLSTGGIFPRTSVNSPLYVGRLYMQGCLVTFCITQEGLCIIHLRYYFNGFVFFVCISVHPLSTGGIFPRSSVNSPLYVRRPYMQGCLVTFCINTRRPLHY